MTTRNALNITLAGQSGTGAVAGNVSPSFTTPALGTPSAGVLTNCTGIPAGSMSGVLPVANGGTGVASTTAYGLVAGGTTSAGAFQNAGTGTANQLYISNGNAALGTWVDSLNSGKVMRGVTNPWTPTIQPQSGSFGTITYALRSAEYTSVGNVCYWMANIELSAFSIGSATGYFALIGVPLTSAGSGALNYPGSTVLGNITYTGNTVVPVVSGGSSTTVFVSSSTGAGTYVLQCSDLSSSSKIYASGFFFTS